MTQLTNQLEAQMAGMTGRNWIKDLERAQWATHQQVARHVVEMQTIFQNQGLQTGDSVLLGLPNSYRFVVVFLAALKTGITVTSVDPEIPLPELMKIVQRQPYQAFIQDEGQNAAQCSPSFTQHFRSQLLTVVDYPIRFWQTTATRNGQQVTELTEETYALKMYTSGTTGSPKIVGITHQQLFATVQNIIHSHELTANDRTYVCLPLFHINAQVISLLASIIVGSQLVIGQKFSARTFWTIIQAEAISWVSVAPAILTILLKRATAETVSHHLRFVRSASAPLAPSLATEFEQRFQVPIIESYGMTEGASQICINPLPPHIHKKGSVGKPFGVKLKIMDDAGQPCATEVIGEVWLQGPSIIDRYLDRPIAEDFVDGWFKTGDLGYLDQDGFVFLVGRKKEMINRGGEKISPYEVEDVLLQVADVHQVAVVALPDEIVGQKVAAFCLLPEDPKQQDKLEEAMRRHCDANLSKFKRPEHYFFVAEIPTGPTGKIQRKKIVEQIY